MELDTRTAPTSKRILWAGRMIGALPVLQLRFSAVMKLVKPPEVVEGFTRLGYGESLALCIGILELVCTVVYVIPHTSILGAILWTGGKFYEAPLRENLEIYDRIGGGDSFASGLAYGFLAGKTPQQCVEYGAAHGALAMTTPGDTSMATLKEVEAVIMSKGARVVR